MVFLVNFFFVLQIAITNALNKIYKINIRYFSRLRFYYLNNLYRNTFKDTDPLAEGYK